MASGKDMDFESALAAIGLRHRRDAHERALLDIGKRCLYHAGDLRIGGERHFQLGTVACLDHIS